MPLRFLETTNNSRDAGIDEPVNRDIASSLTKLSTDGWLI
jgi:hypothetical protein